MQALVRRLDDVRLQHAVGQVPSHSAYSRAPVRAPITFTPGPPEGVPAETRGAR